MTPSRVCNPSVCYGHCGQGSGEQTSIMNEFLMNSSTEHDAEKLMEDVWPKNSLNQEQGKLNDGFLPIVTPLCDPVATNLIQMFS